MIFWAHVSREQARSCSDPVSSRFRHRISGTVRDFLATEGGGRGGGEIATLLIYNANRYNSRVRDRCAGRKTFAPIRARPVGKTGERERERNKKCKIKRDNTTDVPDSRRAPLRHSTRRTVCITAARYRNELSQTANIPHDGSRLLVTETAARQHVVTLFAHVRQVSATPGSSKNK